MTIKTFLKLFGLVLIILGFRMICLGIILSPDEMYEIPKEIIRHEWKLK